MKIDINNITACGKAKKTKGLRARPMHHLIEPEIANKVVLLTLDGLAKIDMGAWLCIGPTGDVWQEPFDALEWKYDRVKIKDGWHYYEPKPGNEVNCVKVTANMTEHRPSGLFYILAKWGEEGEDGLRQYGVVGDYILQNPTDINDVWVVKEKVFENTYECL